MENNLEKFKEITEKMSQTYEAKNHDYGNSFDESCNKFGFVAAVVRMNDKINRINSLYDKESSAKVDESIDDNLLDLANYAIMAIIWRKQHGN